jgi:DNA-binding IclR family transcriptional regulator
MMAPRNAKYSGNHPQVTIPSLARGLHVLQWIADQEGGVSFLELEREFPIPKTTLFRIVKTLVREGWLEQEGERYLAGVQAFNLGASAGSRYTLRQLADGYLDKLSELTRETAHLAVRSGNLGLIIAVRDGPSHIRISSRPGSLSPLHCTAPGKALLAFGLDDEELEATVGPEPLAACTEQTITDLVSLRAELKGIRDRGYSVDEREYYSDVRCVASPVFDRHGNVVAAIGITAPVASFGPEKVRETGEHVMDIASSLSGRLGYAGGSGTTSR